VKLLAVIPHYNHPTTIGVVANAMREMNIDCLIVDDGSDAVSQMALENLEKEGFQVLYRPKNGGKGAAVKDGIRYAKQHNYSHVLQVDADAQHQLSDSQKLLASAQAHPEATICAEPIYGADAPKSRLYGRKLTNFWLAINTLSLNMKDGMCGFRIYPVNITYTVIENERVGNFMDFDVEILVRLHRHDCPVIWVPTPVQYAQDGVSHFRPWKDNLLISKMHTRLFFSMLGQLPRLLKKRWS
jgi:glycosyltransferase involved in cell wall biosynthesis